MYKYKINTKHQLFLNTFKRYIHSKHKHHNLKNYKVFIDPFENLKNIQKLSNNYNIIFKIDNKYMPFKLDTLDLTCDYDYAKDDKCNLESHTLFNFNINEDDDTISVEPKPLEELEDIIKNSNKEYNQLHLIFKATNTERLQIQLTNCDLRIHNSTHFKNEISDSEGSQIKIKPNFLNPALNKVSFTFDKSIVNFEKFDHKFVNHEYSYNLDIKNGSNINIKKIFIYEMDISIASSRLEIDKIMGYKKSESENNQTKNNLKIDASSSSINIKNFINCGHLELNSINDGETLSHHFNNNIEINNFTSNSFDMKLVDNDNLILSVYEISDNSRVKYNFHNSRVRIHPLLLNAVNVYEVLTNKFMSLLMMGRDGYVFCPTIVLDTNQEIKKRDIQAWEMFRIKNSKYYKYLILLFLYLFICVFTVEEKVNHEVSLFKHYQLFFKKTVDNYLKSLN